MYGIPRPANYKNVVFHAVHPQSGIKSILRTWSKKGAEPNPFQNLFSVSDTNFRTCRPKFTTGQICPKHIQNIPYYRSASVIVVCLDSTYDLPAQDYFSHFGNVPVILVLTKCDLLAEKLRRPGEIEDYRTSLILKTRGYGIKAVVEVSIVANTNMEKLLNLIVKIISPTDSSSDFQFYTATFLRGKEFSYPTLSPYDRCKACFHNERDSVLSCGHFSVCHNCAVTKSICPECYKKIKDYVQVF